MQKGAFSVSVRSHTKEKLTCSNAKFVENGTISSVWASLEQRQMHRTWSSAA